MNATILPEKEKHYPVLLNEIVSIITPQYGGTFIDCTFGQGGYSKKILEYSKSKVIALDRDKDSKSISLKIKKIFKERFHFENKKFSQINKLDLKNENIKSIIFDLGYFRKIFLEYFSIKSINFFASRFISAQIYKFCFRMFW